MQINISARHGHLSDATRDKITAKVEKLARLFERLSAIEVTVDLEHEQNPRWTSGFRRSTSTTSWPPNSRPVDGRAGRRDSQARTATAEVQRKGSGPSPPDGDLDTRRLAGRGAGRRVMRWQRPRATCGCQCDSVARRKTR